jgi:CheY-like chemotaxis protein
MNHSLKPILLVEDSEEDREALLRAFKQIGLDNPIFHCESADEALDFLFQRGRYRQSRDTPRPGVILLDLNLPGLDGRELLLEIKNNPKTRAIPVIIVTTSSSSRDVDKCYHSGASGYIQKPVDYGKFVSLIQGFIKYWFEVVILPDLEPMQRMNHDASDSTHR